MANRKITELTYNTNPTLDDVFPAVNSGETKQLSFSGFIDFAKPFITSGLPEIGFLITPNTINQDVNLPEYSTVRFLGPLTMGDGYVINIPITTTLIILDN